MIYILFSVCVLCGLLLIVIGVLVKKLQVHIQENTKTEQLNQKIEENNKRLNSQAQQLEHLTLDKKKELEEVESRIKQLQELYNTTKDDYIKQAKEQAETQAEIIRKEIAAEEDRYRNSLTNAYQELLNDLFEESQRREAEIEELGAVLAQYKATQNAYIEEQKRKEAIEKEKDFYRLALSEQDIADIQALRHVQASLRRKEAIDKVIWSVYYKPAFDVLAANVLKGKDVVGIYKITNLENGKAYVGQSSQIKTRWTSHIKSAIDCGTTQNKLYLEMKKYDLYNFSFELLEETTRGKLDEREKYWIDFYQTKEFGLNATKGNG